MVLLHEIHIYLFILNLLCHMHLCEKNCTYTNFEISPVFSENRAYQIYRTDSWILFACNRRL